jgi:hypothetical protein
MTEATTNGYTQDNHPDANVQATWKALDAAGAAVTLAIDTFGINHPMTLACLESRNVVTAAFLAACENQGSEVSPLSGDLATDVLRLAAIATAGQEDAEAKLTLEDAINTLQYEQVLIGHNWETDGCPSCEEKTKLTEYQMCALNAAFRVKKGEAVYGSDSDVEYVKTIGWGCGNCGDETYL